MFKTWLSSFQEELAVLVQKLEHIARDLPHVLVPMPVLKLTAPNFPSQGLIARKA